MSEKDKTHLIKLGNIEPLQVFAHIVKKMQF
jgi:hypothetical protein